jgi:hypothetical protein
MGNLYLWIYTKKTIFSEKDWFLQTGRVKFYPLGSKYGDFIETSAKMWPTLPSLVRPGNIEIA